MGFEGVAQNDLLDALFLSSTHTSFLETDQQSEGTGGELPALRNLLWPSSLQVGFLALPERGECHWWLALSISSAAWRIASHFASFEAHGAVSLSVSSSASLVSGSNKCGSGSGGGGGDLAPRRPRAEHCRGLAGSISTASTGVVGRRLGLGDREGGCIRGFSGRPRTRNAEGELWEADSRWTGESKTEVAPRMDVSRAAREGIGTPLLLLRLGACTGLRERGRLARDDDRDIASVAASMSRREREGERVEGFDAFFGTG
jgi:hypothetical protein